MQTETLPGLVPTARLELEVLLGPRGEIDVLTVKVQDPSGRLIALRTWPLGVKDSPSAKLDAAWRTLLNALPSSTFETDYR